LRAGRARQRRKLACSASAREIVMNVRCKIDQRKLLTGEDHVIEVRVSVEENEVEDEGRETRSGRESGESARPQGRIDGFRARVTLGLSSPDD
jgi:hypothetical protein